MTINPLFRRLVLLTAFLCTLVLTTQQSGVLQGASEPSPRDYDLIHQIFQGNPQDYYLPQENTASPPLEIDPQQVANLTPDTAIAFTSFRFNQADLFLYDINSSIETRLTSASSTQTDPSLNGDSTTLYFSSNQTGNSEIFAMETNGQNVRQLTNIPAADYNGRVSPDGTKIVFQSTITGNSEIFVVNVDGTNLVQLTFNAPFDGYPNWSPDSSQIIYSSFASNSYNLWIMNVDGSGKRQITAGAVAITPDWSPDGSQIVYANDSDRDGFFEIWLVNADGSNPRYVQGPYSNVNTDFWNPSWSPYGDSFLFITTAWINHQGQWYWIQSHLNRYDLTGGAGPATIYDDDAIWDADWANTDNTPPESCTVSGPSQARDNQIALNWWGASNSYGKSTLQMRALGQSNWQTLIANDTKYGLIYPHSSLTGQFEFRCQLCDRVGNCTTYESAPVKTVELDAARPESKISVSQNYTADSAVPVHIQGTDIGQGIDYYIVHVKDGAGGNWEVWQPTQTTNNFIFEGEAGHTYYFKSQAVDEMGHVEPWEPVADDFVVFGATSLAGFVTDNRGNPAVATPLQLSPSPIYTSETYLPFAYEFLLGEYFVHTLTFQPAGYDPLPSTVLDTTSDNTLNLALAPEDNLLSNSHFETGDTAGWNGSGFTADTTYHTGEYGLALTQELTETAALTQTVVLTDTLHEPTLALWYHIPVTLENRALIVSVQGISDTVQVISTTAATSGWVHAWADVSALAGQTVTVSIEATAGAGSVYLDEITLGSWYTPQITEITPTSWGNSEPITLTITGSNFMATPTVWIAGVEMTSTTWISPTELVVNVPAGVPSGQYFVEVQNPNESKNFSPEKVHIDDLSVYLPLINWQALARAEINDWSTLGHNPQHTGHNTADKGASYYLFRWSKTLPAPQVPYPLGPVAVVDNVLVAISHGYFSNRSVVALDAQTGTQRWLKFYPSVHHTTPPSIAYGQIYFVDNGYEGSLHALNLYTGHIAFEKPIIANYYVEPLNVLIAEEKLYFPGRVFNLLALDAANGIYEAWANPITSLKWSPAYDNGVIYAWFQDELSESVNFRGYHASTGQVLWELKLDVELDGLLYNAPVIFNNTAFVVANYKLIAIDLVNKNVRWMVGDEGDDYEDSMPAVVDNSLYVIKGGTLEERDITTGELIWTSSLTELVHAPVIAGNYVYVASENHTYVINRTTHEIEWEAPQGGWLTVANGYLYIAQADNKLYAYQAQKP